MVKTGNLLLPYLTGKNEPTNTDSQRPVLRCSCAQKWIIGARFKVRPVQIHRCLWKNVQLINPRKVWHCVKGQKGRSSWDWNESFLKCWPDSYTLKCSYIEPLAEGTGYLISGISCQLMQRFTTDMMNHPPEEEGIFNKVKDAYPNRIWSANNAADRARTWWSITIRTPHHTLDFFFNFSTFFCFFLQYACLRVSASLTKHWSKSLPNQSLLS